MMLFCHNFSHKTDQSILSLWLDRPPGRIFLSPRIPELFPFDPGWMSRIFVVRHRVTFQRYYYYSVQSTDHHYLSVFFNIRCSAYLLEKHTYTSIARQAPQCAVAADRQQYLVVARILKPCLHLMRYLAKLR